MSDFSKYNLTPSAKNLLSKSQKCAEKYGHLKVIDIHMIYVLFAMNHSNIDFAMETYGWLRGGFRKAIEMVLEEYTEPKRKKKIFSPEIFEILDYAQKISKKHKNDYIGLDHILLSILKMRREIRVFFIGLDCNVDEFCTLLEHTIVHGIEDELPPPIAGAAPTVQPQAKTKTSISDYCENINNTIQEKGTFEIFGREEETKRAYEILLRKNKSNIILVGEAGVGKTAIVEGIVEKIIQKKCPSFLQGKKILSLDMTSLLSGTMYRGQMEEKVKKIIDEITSNEDYILFIDEIHTIVGSGNSEGSLDLANSLKPVLSRGNFRCIGATTREEYEKYFKGDSALNRRFEKIDVFEPSKEQTLSLIKKAKTSYEKFHDVKFTTKILEIIVNLGEEFLIHQKFPDKAFDIIDEAGAKTKIENNGKFVKTSTIYEIFAQKLNTTVENVKNKNNIPLPGKIGFM